MYQLKDIFDVFLPQLLLYPNPTQGKNVTLKIPEEILGNAYQVQLFDLQGKLYTSLQSSAQEVEFDLASYPTGTYFLTLSAKHYFQRQVLFISP